MFTGLIEEMGTVVSVRRDGRYQRVEIAAGEVLHGTVAGDSISIDGVCQTVTSMRRGRFSVETLAVSLEKTTLGEFIPGRRVNLERAVTPATRLGGHFVQGHVDGVARLKELRRDQHNVFLMVEIPEDLLIYCVPEGSVALDGVSLTIAEIRGSVIAVNIIPLTWEKTALQDRSVGAGINVEVDIIGRYVARMMGAGTGHGGTDQGGLTEEKLARWGFV